MLNEGFEVHRMLNEGVDDGWSKSMEDVLKLLYVDCKLIHLTTILQIFNLQVVHGWTNENVYELLELLSQLLPPSSTLPTKQTQFKNQIPKLGLGYENINTCVNGCVLFQKNISSETRCLKCEEEMYIPMFKSIVVPRKVVCHFSLIP